MFRMKVKSGQVEKVQELFDEWEKDRQPKIKGVVGGLLLKPDNKPGELIGAGIFADKDAFMANANDPEQDRWFRRTMEHLESEPD